MFSRYAIFEIRNAGKQEYRAIGDNLQQPCIFDTCLANFNYFVCHHQLDSIFLRKLAVECRGLLAGLQCLLPPPDSAETVGQVVQRPRQIGREGFGPLGGRQRLLPPPEGAEAIGQII